MDTSILSALSMIAPDLMREIELRTLVLERVAALEPIGRRALAQRLQLPEREVRSAADALRACGCVSLSAAGMELTDHGRSLVDTARAVSRGRRSLSSMELALARKLDVERVCVVRGDADVDESVLAEAAQTAARQIRFPLQDAQVLAVSAGRTMRMTAEATPTPAPRVEVTATPQIEITPTPAPVAAKTYITLRKGDEGPDVVTLQQALAELGYLSGAADGNFGTGTQTAVRKFQEENGLDADGIAGKMTQEALFAKTSVTPIPDTTVAPGDIMNLPG